MKTEWSLKTHGKRVKIKSKLTNLMNISRIEGYNGKYGLNPQGIQEGYSSSSDRTALIAPRHLRN